MRYITFKLKLDDNEAVLETFRFDDDISDIEIDQAFENFMNSHLEAEWWED